MEDGNKVRGRGVEEREVYGKGQGVGAGQMGRHVGYLRLGNSVSIPWSCTLPKKKVRLWSHCGNGGG